MKIGDLSGKNICILGYGREGRAMAAALEEHAAGCRITIADENGELKIDNGKVKIQLGNDWLKDIEKFDIVIKSPGIPPEAIENIHCKELTTPTQIFFDTIKNSGAPVIGVTGSKGKSTTSSLIAHIFNYQFSIINSGTVCLIGNIGEPAISHLKDAKKGTIFVMEMSSYQLMDLQTSPQIAIITSFFPEHLDYHGSVEAYQEAKMHITRFQTENDLVFFCATSYGATEIAKEGGGTKIPFSADDSPVSIEETNLIGAHNLSNIAGAFTVAMKLGISEEDAIAAIKTFHGLPHRLQSLGIHHEIEWIDDAISTTPESAIAALDALGDRVTTIILGGQDRGYDFGKLGIRIAESSVKNVILFPGSGPRIKKAIEEAKADVSFFEVTSMEEAVTVAKKEARSQKLEAHPIVLLSPASPSYGMFKNFEEKGDCFKKEIEK